MMMGRALERLSAAPAGNVVAIGGLEEAVLKSATLASTPAAPPLAPVEHQAEAIVQVCPLRTPLPAMSCEELGKGEGRSPAASGALRASTVPSILVGQHMWNLAAVNQQERPSPRPADAI